MKAGVAWYGHTARAFAPGDKQALDVAGKIKAPMLGLYGAADGGIPNDSVEKMFASVEGLGQHQVGIHAVSRHAARVQRRLPAELSQAAGRGRVEQDAGVVEAQPVENFFL